jgi:hypothetical protein
MNRRDGGPAFPGMQTGLAVPIELVDQVKAVKIPHNGMSVRDYFAAHAPIDLADARNQWHKMHGSGSRQPSMQDILALLALLRGEYADAMTAERSAA